MSFFLKSRKNGVAVPRKLLLLGADLAFIFLSMAAAYVIRSRFIYFIFSDLYLAYCLPYVFLFRLIVNLVFDFYSLDLRFMTIRDVLRIYTVNLIPTFLFSLIRIFSPIEFLRIPFSIIFAEYFFTVLLISLSRIIINSNLKKHKAKTRGFRYGKNALLLLNLQFSPQTLPQFGAGQPLSVVGILTENRLLWGSDHQNFRVIGGLGALKDLIIAHNHDLFVVIDETLDDSVKRGLYAESIELGASPVILSNGRIRYPSLPDLLPGQTPIADHVPSEIERWLETRRCTFIGDEFGLYPGLAAFLDGLKVPFTTLLSPAATETTVGSLALDFRFLAAYENGALNRGRIDAIADSLLSAAVPDCLVIVPKRAAAALLARTGPRPGFTILFINDYFLSDRQIAFYAASAGRFDRATESIAAVFKALYCNREAVHRRYYYDALEKIDMAQLAADPRLSLLAPPFAPSATGWEPQRPAGFHPGRATPYCGLFWSDDD